MKIVVCMDMVFNKNDWVKICLYIIIYNYMNNDLKLIVYKNSNIKNIEY